MGLVPDAVKNNEEIASLIRDGDSISAHALLSKSVAKQKAYLQDLASSLREKSDLLKQYEQFTETVGYVHAFKNRRDWWEKVRKECGWKEDVKSSLVNIKDHPYLNLIAQSLISKQILEKLGEIGDDENLQQLKKVAILAKDLAKLNQAYIEDKLQQTK